MSAFGKLPSAGVGGGTTSPEVMVGVKVEREGSAPLYFADFVSAAAAASQDDDRILLAPGPHACDSVALLARVSIGCWGAPHSAVLVAGSKLFALLGVVNSGTTLTGLRVEIAATTTRAIECGVGGVEFSVTDCIFEGAGNASAEVFYFGDGRIRIRDCVSRVSSLSGIMRVLSVGVLDVDGLIVESGTATALIRVYGVVECLLHRLRVHAGVAATYGIVVDVNSRLSAGAIHIEGITNALTFNNDGQTVVIEGFYPRNCTNDVHTLSSTGAVITATLAPTTLDPKKINATDAWMDAADLRIDGVSRGHLRRSATTGKITEHDTFADAQAYSTDTGDTFELGWGDIAEDIVLSLANSTLKTRYGLGSTRVVGTAGNTDRISVTASGCVIRNLEVEAALNNPFRALRIDLPLATDTCTVDGIYIYGQSGGTGWGVRATNGFVNARDIYGLSHNISVLFEGTGVGTRVSAENIKALSGNYNDVISVQDGAVCTLRNLDILATATVTDGVSLGAATLQLLGGFIEGAANAIHIVADGATMQMFDVHLASSSAFDVLIDPTLTGAGSHIDFGAGLIAAERISAPAGWANTVSPHAMLFEETISGTNVKIWGANFSVGAPWQNAEIVTGHGQSSTANMQIKRETSLGVFDNVEALIKAGTPTAIFSDLAAGSRVYFGSPWIMCNIKAGWAVAASPTFNAHTAGGALAEWEIFNGVTWEHINIAWQPALADAEGRKSPTGTEGALLVQQEHLQLGPNWVDNTLTVVDGEALYWLRCTLLLPLTTSPQADLIKIGMSRIEFDAGGGEAFGHAQPANTIIKGLSRASLESLNALLMADYDIPLGATNVVKATGNGFQGTRDDACAAAFAMPWNANASHPLHVDLHCFYQSVGVSTTSDFVFELYVVNEGNVYNSALLAPIVLTQSLTIAAAQYEKFTIHIDFDLNAFAEPVRPETSMYLTFRRNGSSGTTGNNIAIAGLHAHIPRITPG